MISKFIDAIELFKKENQTTYYSMSRIDHGV